MWDRTTGEPVYNAIVWQDTRTDGIVRKLGDLGGGQDRYKAKVGLPLATYFSGPKVRWILDNVDGAREKAEKGDLVFGNMDTWVLWNMTGGRRRRPAHHRPDQRLPDHADGPGHAVLGRRHRRGDGHSAVHAAGDPLVLRGVRDRVDRGGNLPGVPIAGILGDQQAATFGQACLSAGEAKNTYGTGNFMLLNTGTEKVPSNNGLLTTVCYKIGDNATVYALEGSIAVTGSLVQWVRDNLELIDSGAGDRGPGQERRGLRWCVLRAGVLRPVRARTGATTPAAPSSG